MTLKKNDSYHYSIPFEFIEKNNGGPDDEIGIAYMDVDVEWSDNHDGYVISHYCSEMNVIDPNEGNGDEDEFFEHIVFDEVLNRLAMEGIGVEAICSNY